MGIRYTALEFDHNFLPNLHKNWHIPQYFSYKKSDLCKVSSATITDFSSSDVNNYIILEY